MFVTKRNHTKEPIHFDKITTRIARLIQPHESKFIDPVLVAQKVISSIYNGITTTELDIESAKICANLATTHPLYSQLGGRILVSNLHKNTENLGGFTDKLNRYQQKYDLLDPTWLKFINTHSTTINAAINYELDYTYDYFGFKTLENAYLLKYDDEIFERPQDLWMRVASFVQMGDIDLTIKIYQLLSRGCYTHATPTLFHSGMRRAQLASCFLLDMEDSTESIVKTWGDIAQISRYSGGIGLNVSNIRAKNSVIKSTNGRASGLIKLLKVLNEISREFDQSGKRPGSIATYLEPHHPEIFQFLEIKKNTGSETERCRDLFPALWVSDLFMRQVESDGDWWLMSNDVCPNLNDVYGVEFERLFMKYVSEGKFVEVVKARKVMKAILDSQIETGTPYIAFKDAVNSKSNQKNIGVIKSSNLCVAPETLILTDQGYCEIQKLKDQSINIWNGEEFSNVTIKQTGENQELIKILFSNGLSIECTPYHKFYIKEGYSSNNNLTKNKSIKIIEARDLQKGMKLIKTDYPVINGKPQNKLMSKKSYYTHGLFTADGTYCKRSNEKCSAKRVEGSYYCLRHLKVTDVNPDEEDIVDDKCCMDNKDRPIMDLYGEKKELLKYVELRYNSSIAIREVQDKIRICLPNHYPPKFEIPFKETLENKLAWLAGLADGDGTIARNGTNQSLQIGSIDYDFCKNLVLFFHTLGVDAKINLGHEEGERLMPDGKGGEKLYNCKQSYRVLVNSYDLHNLINLGFETHRLIINKHKPNRNAKQFVTIESIEQTGRIDTTFCFTEPKRHTGIFNGIITGNCNEVVLHSNSNETATCNLASISLPSCLKPFTPTIKFIIYTKDNCKYCTWAKNYLSHNNFEFTEINKLTPEVISYIQSLNRPISYPQIYYGEQYVGGFNDLFYFIKSQFDFELLEEIAYHATLSLNNVIDFNFYPTPETQTSNLKHRPIGVGIQGLADVFAQMKINFDSEEAIEFNKIMMETIYYGCMKASLYLAKQRTSWLSELRELILIEEIIPEFYDKSLILPGRRVTELYHKLRLNKFDLTNKTYIGAYSTFEGSPIHHNKFQFDLWGEPPKLKAKWDELYEEIQYYGIRNSTLTALMPTASTSQILGNNECFEYFTNNIYTRRTVSGDFVIVNKHMVNDLASVGCWDPKIKDEIILNNGSVQTLSQIPPQIRNLYKTIWEIPQSWVLKQARARAPYVCMTQSMNLFYESPDYQKLFNCHMWSWKNGLKTGMYYLRSRPATEAIKITVCKKEDEGCLNCSA